MAGHSKWANIKHRKALADKKKAKVFTKVIKELTVSAQLGGGDPDANPRLRSAIQLAKKNNMPRDTMERAIKKGTGEGLGSLNEISYEGYGPGGVAIFVECTTDNVTRTVANIRSYFNKNEGSLGKDGCLQFVFERKAIFSLPSANINEDDFTLAMIDVGAEDVQVEDGFITVTAAMESFGSIQKKFEELKIEPEDAGLERIPLSTKNTDVETFQKIMKLIDIIEDDDDVQKVYHNMEYNEELANTL